MDFKASIVVTNLPRLTYRCLMSCIRLKVCVDKLSQLSMCSCERIRRPPMSSKPNIDLIFIFNLLEIVSASKFPYKIIPAVFTSAVMSLVVIFIPYEQSEDMQYMCIMPTMVLFVFYANKTSILSITAACFDDSHPINASRSLWRTLNSSTASKINIKYQTPIVYTFCTIWVKIIEQFVDRINEKRKSRRKSEDWMDERIFASFKCPFQKHNDSFNMRSFFV